MAIFLAVNASLRRGELCGLRWSDLDTDACTLRVERQWVPGVGGQYLADLRSGTGVVDGARTVPLDPTVVEAVCATRRGSEPSSSGSRMAGCSVTTPDPLRCEPRASARQSRPSAGVWASTPPPTASGAHTTLSWLPQGSTWTQQRGAAVTPQRSCFRTIRSGRTTRQSQRPPRWRRGSRTRDCR